MNCLKFLKMPLGKRLGQEIHPSQLIGIYSWLSGFLVQPWRDRSAFRDQLTRPISNAYLTISELNFTSAYFYLLTTECGKLVHIWMPALQTSIFGQMSFTATDLYHKLQSLLPATSSHSHTPSSLKLTQLSLSYSRFEGCQGPQLHNNQFFYPPATQRAWKLELLQLPISCLES